MANVIYNYTQMKFKQAYCDLVIPRLRGPGTSLLIINFGKTISSKFTKNQNLWVIVDYIHGVDYMCSRNKLPSVDVNSQLQYLFANGFLKSLNKAVQFFNEVLEMKETLINRK